MRATIDNNPELQKLPVGIQTFSEIIQKNYLYIDKTKEALELIQNHKYTFLSRPRRFGKSLFLDTLQEIFEGNKELFKELYIYDKWSWSIKYPVIKISWSGLSSNSIDEIYQIADDSLLDNQNRLHIKCDKNIPPQICLKQLIKKAYERYKIPVVILIDEYDKPILNNILNITLANQMRDFLRGFYEQLKENDRYIKFVFLTGVSKFSKASIFSGLNNLTDISLNPKFGNICGYTQKNIENEFKEYFKNVDLQKVKSWYNGYNFLKDKVYNPFDILLLITNDFKFSNYWFETGTPLFLIELIKENSYFLPNLAGLKVDEKLLNSFDLENLDLEVILYQAGYLTIDQEIEKRRGGIEYKLKLPNREIKLSLNDYIIDLLLRQKTEKLKIQDSLYDALYESKLEDFKISLTHLFATIPYNNLTYIKSYEGFYASVIYVYLQSLGIEIIGEDVTNRGRIDLTIFINDIIYIIEFKVGSNDALTQIKEKNYSQKYRGLNKDIYLIGINFDETEKNISRFIWEKV